MYVYMYSTYNLLHLRDDFDWLFQVKREAHNYFLLFQVKSLISKVKVQPLSFKLLEIFAHFCFSHLVNFSALINFCPPRSIA